MKISLRSCKRPVACSIPCSTLRYLSSDSGEGLSIEDLNKQGRRKRAGRDREVWTVSEIQMMIWEKVHGAKVSGWVTKRPHSIKYILK